jgi:transcriptional regulator with XRE-family HTH domain
MNKESRARGYVLTEESLNLFKEKQSKLDLTQEKIEEETALSVSSVNRLLNGTAVQKNTVYEIAKVLEIDSADIKLIAAKDVVQKIASKSVCGPSQTILTNIKVSGSLKAGDFILKAPGGTSVEQVVLHDVYAENIELGNVTLEG